MEELLAIAPQDEKLSELILLFSRFSEGDAPFAKVKLAKLLLFADVRAYLKSGESITGQDYIKLEHGPVPRRMDLVLTSMQRNGDLAARPGTYHERPQCKYFALREVDPDKFSSDELMTAFQIIEDFWGKTARQMSDLAHESLGWQLAEEKETIPLSVFLVGDREVTEAERERGKELEGLARVCLQQGAS